MPYLTETQEKELIDSNVDKDAQINRLRAALKGYDDWVRRSVRFDRDRDVYFAEIVDAGRRALAEH